MSSLRVAADGHKANSGRRQRAGEYMESVAMNFTRRKVASGFASDGSWAMCDVSRAWRIAGCRSVLPSNKSRLTSTSQRLDVSHLHAAAPAICYRNLRIPYSFLWSYFAVGFTARPLLQTFGSLPGRGKFAREGASPRAIISATASATSPTARRRVQHMSRHSTWQ